MSDTYCLIHQNLKTYFFLQKVQVAHCIAFALPTLDWYKVE